MNVTSHKYSVLAVDDDAGVLSVLAKQLGADFEVITASSAEEARAVLARRSVDMILSDLHLPDETGLSLLEWARRTTPRTSRVLLTGTARLEDAVDAINRTQVHRMVLKPWRGEDLLQTVWAAARAVDLERSHDRVLDDLRRLNMELERRVIERTHDLEVALAQLRQLNDTLRDLALTDTLTGLPNLRAINMIASNEFARRSRVPSPLTLVMIDADHFKQINTDHGYSGGNHVLIWLAGVLKDNVRESDSVARLHGEEFLVIAPGTDEAGAVKLAERLRSKVAARPTFFKDRPISLTISLGVVVVEGGVKADYKTLREVVEAAVKEAKETGKNRAVVKLYTPQQ